MNIFAWILMILSGIGFILYFPIICNSKFLKGLYLLVSGAANTFYFVSYLFFPLEPGIFTAYTWGVLALSAISCLVGLLFSDDLSVRAISLVSHAPQLIFFILALVA